ncbi:probable serine/threonine-protein kinase ifkA [Magallana gigas]|uniref:probable serine/threonine-protein kinase ifkA n=1 Tax=Magallana gigas TaxID=29159 RepID=UPI00334233ED
MSTLIIYLNPKFHDDKLVDVSSKIPMKSRPINYMYNLRDRQQKDQSSDSQQSSSNQLTNSSESQIPSEELNILGSENNTSEEHNTENSATSSENTTPEEHNTENSATSSDNNPSLEQNTENAAPSGVNNTSHEQTTENVTENHIENSERIIVNMTTGINLKKFSGSENVHLWLSHLDSWQKFHNVTDGAALLAIGCNLEGQAETWLQTLSPRQRNNLTEFKECLKNRFAPQETNFTLLSIRQQAGETADVYLSRAEKTALGHDLPEIYKVQFAIQGLENQVKAKVISKEPKTFQELRHAVSLAKAQLECNTTEDMNNLTLVALAAQLKDSLKAEISALTQSNCQSRNGQPEPWSKPPNPHPQWQQFAPPPPGYSVPVCQT